MKRKSAKSIIQTSLNFLLIFCVVSILFLTSLYMLFLKETEEISEIEKRKLATFEQLKETVYLDQSFQDSLENATGDQFPFRYDIVTLKRKIDYFHASLFDKNANEDSLYRETINPEDYYLHRIGESGTFRVGNSNYIVLDPLRYNEAYVARYQTKIEQINQLARDYPEIGVFVYKPVQAHETSIFDEYNEIESYGDEYHKLLQEGLQVPYKQMQLKTLKEYKKYYYQQDHHWNHKGSYQGYVDIVHLIFGENENVLKPKEEITNNDELLWSGTMGTRTGYVLPFEPFHYYTYDSPKYHVFYKGEEVPVLDMNNFDEQLKANKSSYYYGFLNNNGQEFVEFVSEKEGMPSLLILGDSYAQAVEPLLMEHFSHIYFVSQQNYRWLYNGGNFFDIDAFIAETKVDNILIMYTGENWYLDSTYEDFELHRSEVK